MQIIPQQGCVMAYLHVLEKQTWLTAGLRREFPEFQQEILHRQKATEFLQLPAKSAVGLKLLDMDALPEEATEVLIKTVGQPISQQTLVLINREQIPFLQQILLAESLCYIEKPISVFRLGQLCRQFLERQKRI